VEGPVAQRGEYPALDGEDTGFDRRLIVHSQLLKPAAIGSGSVSPTPSTP
jgi:hypothetical protein